MNVLSIISSVLILTGAVFFLIAAAGIIRFPDFYTRLHAAGIGDTFGAMMMTAGIMIHTGWSLLTLKVLAVFIIYLITNPLGTNLIIMEAIHAKDYQGYNRRKARDVIRDNVKLRTKDTNSTEDDAADSSAGMEMNSSAELTEKGAKDDSTAAGGTAAAGADIDHAGRDL